MKDSSYGDWERIFLVFYFDNDSLVGILVRRGRGPSTRIDRIRN
jgi:hypothetical protein